MWEKLYKPTPSCGQEVGTLYHLRQSFRLVNVPSDVRKNYANCEMLLLSATKSYLCSAFLTWADIPSTKETPSYVTETLKKDASPTEQWKFLGGYLGKFVLTEFDIEKKWKGKNERKRREKESEQVRSFQESAPVSTENLFPPGTYQISREVPACIGQFVIIRIQNYLNANDPKWAKTAADIMSLTQKKAKGVQY